MTNGTTLVDPLEPAVEAQVLAPELPPGATSLPGILLFVVGLFVLACMDTTTKFLAERFDVPLIVAVRYIVNCLLMVAILAPVQGMKLVRTRRTGLVIVRGASLAAGSLLMGLAYREMPIAESNAICFLTPTLVVLAARPFLGERIGPVGWTAAAAGFAGVLLVARPGSGLAPAGVAFALGAAVVSAAYQLLSRVLAHSVSTIALLFYTALVGALVFGAAAPWFWFGRAPTALELGLFLSLGVTSGIGHFLFTAAYRHASASTLASLSYLQLVWAALLGWLVFGHVPDAIAILGMVVIALSGTAVALKAPIQARLARRAASASP